MILGYHNDQLNLSTLRDLKSSVSSSLSVSSTKFKALYITDEYVLYNDNGQYKYINKHLISNDHDHDNDNDESSLMKFLNLIKENDVKISKLFIGCTSLIVYVDNTENIYMYNDTNIEKIGLSISIDKVAVGDNHIMILSKDHILYSCGDNSHGQLGIDNYHGGYHTQLNKVFVPVNEIVVDIAVSFHHSAFITKSGKCYTFGNGHLFKLGHGDCNDYTIPKLVAELNEFNIRMISLGLMHSCCVTDNHDVYIWGVSVDTKNNNKILALPTRLELTESVNISSIISGSRYIAILCQNNSKVLVVGQLGAHDYDSNDDNNDSVKCRTVFETEPNNIISIIQSHYQIGILL